MKKIILAGLILILANPAYADSRSLGADGPAAVSDLIVNAIIERADKLELTCDDDSEALAKVLAVKNKGLLEAFKKKAVKDFFTKLGISINAKKVFDAAIIQASEDLCSEDEPIDEEEPLPDDDTIPE